MKFTKISQESNQTTSTQSQPERQENVTHETNINPFSEKKDDLANEWSIPQETHHEEPVQTEQPKEEKKLVATYADDDDDDLMNMEF